jgi:hypothetical protein
MGNSQEENKGIFPTYSPPLEFAKACFHIHIFLVWVCFISGTIKKQFFNVEVDFLPKIVYNISNACKRARYGASQEAGSRRGLSTLFFAYGILRAVYLYCRYP